MGHEIGAKICITTKKWTMSDEVQKTAIRADGCTKEERAIRQFYKKETFAVLRTPKEMNCRVL